MNATANNPAIVVLSNLPDKESADKLVEYLIKNKLAACINILAPCQSIYEWQGKIEHATEFPVVIKTNQALYREVEQAILQNHPYELPEIIQVSIDDGYSPYLAWINETLK
jgi:periplasmic divalent cation tolerance protein